MKKKVNLNVTLLENTEKHAVK